MATSIKYRYSQVPHLFHVDGWYRSHNTQALMRSEVMDWLIENFGQPALDMTSFTWGKSRWFGRHTTEMIRSGGGNGNRGGWMAVPCGYEFMFADGSDALLFKLTWGGKK